MARWLKTGALLCASLIAALALIVPPDAWASIFTFKCGQVFGVNSVNGAAPYYVVGFNSSGVGKSYYAGFQANADTVSGSCGVALNVPGATSTFPAAISPDGFVTGVYNPSSGAQAAFVMPISPGNTAGTVLSFRAKDYSGDVNAYSVRGSGISSRSSGLAWVVGAYLTNNGHTSHAYAVQVNMGTAPPTVVGPSWISFDVSVAGSGWARGVDGGGGRIVGSYPDASGNQQGYVLAIADLVTAWKAQGKPAVTLVAASSVATVTCPLAVGGYIHGISNGGRVVGIAFTTNNKGYAFYSDGASGNGAWTPGTTTRVCSQIVVPGASNSSQTWASGISWDGLYMVGQGGGGDWVSTP